MLAPKASFPARHRGVRFAREAAAGLSPPRPAPSEVRPCPPRSDLVPEGPPLQRIRGGARPEMRTRRDAPPFDRTQATRLARAVRIAASCSPEATRGTVPEEGEA